MPVPDTSKSGKWSKGQTYVAPAGGCAGHRVEVINPSIPAVKSITFTQEGGELRAASGLVECVLVRCTVCFDSWKFPTAAELPFDSNDPERHAALAKAVFDEIMANGDDDE